MRSRHLVVFGATSQIAEHAARRMAARDYNLTLCARDSKRLEDIAADLRLRGKGVCTSLPFDADRHDPAAILDSAAGICPVTDCLIAHALPQPSERLGLEALAQYLRVNSASAIAAMHAAADRIADHGQGGCIAWLTSPAGLRGRGVNWLYGASKSCGDVALEGIGAVYGASGVRVLWLRPGPVRTRFNEGLTPTILWTEPERAGKRIASLIHVQATGEYFIPRFWVFPAWIIRMLPRTALARLKS